MKVAYDTRWPDTLVCAQNPFKPQAQDPDLFASEDAATLELSVSAEEYLTALNDPYASQNWKERLKHTSDSGPSVYAKQTSGVRDESGRLTRQLVAASHQNEVRSIVGEAYKNLSELLKTAMSGDSKEAKKAFAAIKRLNKLIRRASRKIGDLDKEDELRNKQKIAEKEQMELRAREIKAELTRRINERKMREKKYLQNEKDKDEQEDKTLTPAQIEAQINALAAMMAQVSAAPPVSPSTAGISTATDGVSIGVASMGSGEISAEGGEAAASAE